MIEKIPLPTDSLYKFLALAGLILFILPFVLIIQINNHTNDTVIRSAISLDSLGRDSLAAKKDSVRVTILTTLRENAISDRKTATRIGGFLVGLGFVMMIYGFRDWKRMIQRHADQISILEVKLKQVELEKERYELQILRRQVPTGGLPTPEESPGEH